MSSVKNKNLTSSFLFRISFTSLSHLVVLARTSTTILNKCGSRHPFFFMIREKAFKRSLLSIMLALVCHICSLLH